VNAFSIRLPSLRERSSDIPVLAQRFLGRYCAANGLPLDGKNFSKEATDLLMQYHWPGNVRQLESAIERAVLLCEGPAIGPEDLPQEIRHRRDEGSLGIEIPDAGISFEVLEKELLEQALRKGRSVSAAARLLGLTRRTLQYRLKKFGLAFGSAWDEREVGNEIPPQAGSADAPAARAPNGAAPVPER